MAHNPSESTQCWCILPAGGIGARMGVQQPKQYIQIHNRPIIEYSLMPFIQHAAIAGIVVCVADTDEIWPSLSVAQNEKVFSTLGGATRAESVLNGLHALQDKAHANDWVLVHDAARPCLPSSAIDDLLAALANEDVGGILALPARDTLKQAGESLSDKRQDIPRVDATLDRSSVWMAQTPQMFRYGLLVESLAAALKQGVTITDEASAIEWAGHAPRLVLGLTHNIKVTTPDDLALVRFLLSEKSVQ